MGQYRIFSEPLGVDFMVEGSEAPNEESTFQILKQVVPPDRMIKAFEDGNKELARAAYKNGYFDQESDTGLYDAFKQAAGEVMEGLGNISKEVSLDFTASGAMTYGVPGSQKLVEGARAEQQKRRRKRKATGYQTMAEVFAGYKTIGDAGKLAFSKMAGEGDEDIDASIQFIGDMMKTQSFIDDGAAIMAEQFGDFDMYRDLKAGRVEPDKKQALAASLFVQLENPVAAVTTGSIRSTTNMLRRGTAKKLAEQFKEANSKKFLLEKQLNRLPANASDTLVKTATDALEKATKESDEILAKITPFTEQKAKAGFTNQMVGKGMQAVGKAGEHFGNLTEFIRRAGVEEATTLLMRAGLSEQVAKGVIYTSIGGAADLTDGEASLTGTGFGALAAYMGPRAIASMGRSSAILGKQLTMAETTMPFFKRVGALPADDPKLAEVLVDRTDNLVLGDAASQLKPILTQTRDLPSSVRGAARFIDRSGLGRLGTETANVAKAAAGGAALPGAFGYMAGGEEGAASAIGASAPFIAAGLGYGSLLRFNNKSDLLAKQLGDLEYHKQSLAETERANFEKLDKDQQVAISTFSQFFPDVEIRMKSMGKDGPNGAHYVDGSDSVIEINTDTNLSYGTILSHEIGHHVERHGLLPNILEEMLGNPEKGKVGIFTEINKATGKPKITTDENGMKHYELTDEFRELQKAYVDKLANSNVSEKAKQAYETPEQFARELFAETVAERMLSGKTSKRAGQSSTYKLIESLGDRITSGGFMRKAMHSLGMATKADGSLVQGTGILGKPFKSSKQLDNLVKRYEDETIGLSESEIREQRPVTKDDELDTVIVSPSDPIESLQVFNNGGHFKTDKDGNIIVNPITKKPEVYSPSETRRANQALARDLTESIKARENDLPEGHVTLSETEDGKLTGSGKFIDDSIIDELSRTGRYNPSQINFLREASKAGREGIGNQMLLFYYAATGKGGRKYKTLKGGYRDSLVYGITITKDGNVILDTVSLDKLQKNIDYLLKRRGNEIGQAFGGSDPAVIRKNFESMFEKYLDNHAKGIVNGTPESGITEGQKNFLNAAFGPVSKSQIADNPTLSNLGERRANTLGTYRSRRLDRIGTLNPTGNTRNIVIDRIRRNLMPGRGEGDKLFIPAYHGTPHTFAPEPGAPFGKFRTSAIGTGEGAQAYGHGLYFAGKKEVAEHYRKVLSGKKDDIYQEYDGQPFDRTNPKHEAARRLNKEARMLGVSKNQVRPRVIDQIKGQLQRRDLDRSIKERLGDVSKVLENKQEAKVNDGSLYKVELAPKENEYLLWDKPLSEQPKGVRDIFIKKYGKEEFDLVKDDLALEWYQSETDYFGSQEQASNALKEAGIPGIKYLDGSSRSKGEGDYNYVIFDEADVQITDKLFMPASEAGAGKGKQAEAAKLWQEKGTDSPYFKKWFGKSKVVDENGEPLVVYHGTDKQFTSFDPEKLSTGQNFEGAGFYFTNAMSEAQSFGKNVHEVYLKLKNPILAQTKITPSEVKTLVAKSKNYKTFKELAEKINRDELNLINSKIEEVLDFPFGNEPFKQIAEEFYFEKDAKFMDAVLNLGYDGVILEPIGNKSAFNTTYIAFSPEQIKSATGNRGTFDAGERNILFMPSKGDTTPASVQSWDDANPTFGANFTKGMAKDNKEAAALLRKSYEDEFGEPIKAQDFTQDQVEWLGDMLAQEGEAALGRTGNAVNWYTSAVEKALSVAEEIFPEIGQKFEAKDRFLGALSITSQNMRVMDNAKAAVSQYQHKIRTGKFDYSIKHGAKADAITSNLKLYDKVEAKMGVKDLHAFLDEDFTVKELTEWGRDFFGDKKFSIAGYSTDKVKGSAIFGPKIGQGFFQNLRGNYDPVTVDLWLRRTYGRLTGLSLDTALSPGDIGRIIYAVRNNKGKRKFAGLKMPNFLKGVSISGKLQKNGVANFKISDKAFESLFGDNTIGRDNYEAIYEFAEKLNREWERSFAKANTDVKKAKDAIKKAKKEDRGTTNLEKQLAKFEAEKVAIGKEKPQWAKAGSTVNDKLKPIDVPSNAERAVITKAFNVALKSLKEKGIDLTPADLQATLWYPEKDIWAYLKGENSDALNMSYDTAMEVIRDQR